MNAISRITRVALWAIAVMIVVAPASAAAQEQTALGSVRLARAVVANGEPLAAGTYTVRLSNDPVAPVKGQSPDSAHWVEFVQGGQVKGRELATVVAPADVKQVAKGTPPAPGSPRVQLLRGEEYMRVWLNHAGTQYLVYLCTTK